MKVLVALYGFVALPATTTLQLVDAWTHGVTSLSSRHPARLPTLRKQVSSLASLKKNDDPVRDDTSYDPLHLSSPAESEGDTKHSTNTGSIVVDSRAWFLGAVALTMTPEMALAMTTVDTTTPTTTVAAAVATSSSAIPSALAAYGHYLSIIVIVASIMTERLTVKPAMSIEEEKRMGAADIMTGIAGTALLVSGYYRATAYGKGWDFYAHEPIFWLKMTFLGIFGALSLFPTITIIQRTVQIQQRGSIEPMSEELASRMKQILNAELSALAVIPLTACLMARGVGYVNDFPTDIVGPTLFAVVTGGAVFKYVKDAITWKEPGKDSAAME